MTFKIWTGASCPSLLRIIPISARIAHETFSSTWTRTWFAGSPMAYGKIVEHSKVMAELMRVYLLIWMRFNYRKYTQKLHLYNNSKNIHLIPDTYKGRLDCSFIFFIDVGVRTLNWDAELANRCKAKIFSTSHGSEPWKCCGLYSGRFCCLTCIIKVLISAPSFAFNK